MMGRLETGLKPISADFRPPNFKGAGFYAAPRTQVKRIFDSI